MRPSGAAAQTKSTTVSAAKARTVSQPPGPVQTAAAATVPTAARALGSVIVPDFPGIFAEFRRKRFWLLWRGGRDGFGAADFHGRCNGHATTLAVILDPNGSIFGGFTPLEWESSTKNCLTADASLKTFLFTLKNPARRPGAEICVEGRKEGRGNRL
jgi:hypothetical protein